MQTDKIGHRRAIIIGGSIAGLFAALLLRRIGWQVEVFERIGSELAGRGAGIVTHPELFQLLEKAGIDTRTAAVGVKITGRRVYAEDGSIRASLDLPQIVTSWGCLYKLLQNALPRESYHHDKNLTHVTESDHSVTANFSDGTSVTGDLLIGADGLFSAVRQQFLPSAAPAYVGYIAWRGLVAEQSLSAHTRESLCDYFGFSLPEGEQMLGYPVAGADEGVERGQRRFNFVWYRPAAEDVLRDLLTDSEGNSSPLSIPPHKIRPDIIATLKNDANRLLAPQFAEVVDKTAQPFIQSILDLEVDRMRLSARTVIIGDAAFVARPHVGMGVTKAAGDAGALADAIANHPMDLGHALDIFEADRLAFGSAVVRKARQLGAYMQAQLLTEEERIAARINRQPEIILAETAVSTGISA